MYWPWYSIYLFSSILNILDKLFLALRRSLKQLKDTLVLAIKSTCTEIILIDKCNSYYLSFIIWIFILSILIYLIHFFPNEMLSSKNSIGFVWHFRKYTSHIIVVNLQPVVLYSQCCHYFTRKNKIRGNWTTLTELHWHVSPLLSDTIAWIKIH